MRRLSFFSVLPVLGFLVHAVLAAAPAEGAALKSDPKMRGTHVGTLEPGTKVTEAYIRMVAREAYFWGWPMANIYNRRLLFSKMKEPGLINGIAPAGPLNRLAMLTDYIDPRERLVTCPNQDVVYGAAILALDLSPVVVQVPNFGKRFWMIQAVDLRTDSFVELGSMYGTEPGYYLLVGPDWQGEVPKGITKAFRSSSKSGMLVPRVFQNDTPEDRKAVQEVISLIDVYPLAEFTGKMKKRDWSKLPNIQSSIQTRSQSEETKWVRPETFFDVLPAILSDVWPLHGEGARYAQMSALAAIAKANPALRVTMIDEAKKTDSEVIAPLLHLRNVGLPLTHHWGTINNGAEFGIDYLTRTAVAKSNILVNKAVETKYFYQDLDESGDRLNGGNNYTVTFGKDLVPVLGFWSLTLYNRRHFFVPNSLNRYSVGTKSRGMVCNPDGSLTIYVQAESPGPGKKANWLPAPMDASFSLYIRAYWPKPEVLDGTWTPPPVILVK